MLAVPAMSGTDVMAEGESAQLRAQYETSAERLRESSLGRPLLLESSEHGDLFSGEVYGLVNHSLDELATALDTPQRWCDLLVMHPYVARCSARIGEEVPVIEMKVTKRVDAAEASGYDLAFTLRRDPAAPDYFGADLVATKGPMATSDYQIRVEAVAIDATSMFLHFRYSYRVAWSTRIALQTWLATAARNCVGFTKTGVSSHGSIEYIRGIRGSTERNVMRYIIAIDALLQARAAPAEERYERGLQYWLAGAERYPRQLMDDEIASYLRVKRRQRPAEPAPTVDTAVAPHAAGEAAPNTEQ